MNHDDHDPVSAPETLTPCCLEAHRPEEEYSLAHCLAHALYVPLYLAGPTITFNAFASQLATPMRTVTNKDVAIYGVRLVVLWLWLEFATHYVPCFAIGVSGVFDKMGPFEVAVLAYCTLKTMWFKFSFIWRFSRWWAMLDGIETVENMVRCMSNNYSLGAFWQGWHRSFNRWLVRYIYVPLGGSKYRWANVWAVFGFVAIWHDINPKLLAWGGMNAVFMTVENLVTDFASTAKVMESLRRSGWIWRGTKAIAASTWVIVLMIINLTGYSVGIDGVGVFLHSLFSSTEGMQTVLGAYIILFAATQIMFDIRSASCGADGREGKVADAPCCPGNNEDNTAEGHKLN